MYLNGGDWVGPDENCARITVTSPERLDTWWEAALSHGLVRASEIPAEDHEVIRASDKIVFHRLISPQPGDERVGADRYYSYWKPDPSRKPFPAATPQVVRVQRFLCRGSDYGQMRCHYKVKFKDSALDVKTLKEEWALEFADQLGLRVGNSAELKIVNFNQIEFEEGLEPSGHEQLMARIITVKATLMLIPGFITVYTCENWIRGLYMAYVTNCTEEQVSVPAIQLETQYGREDASDEHHQIMRFGTPLSSTQHGRMKQTQGLEIGEKTKANYLASVSLVGDHKWLKLNWEYSQAREQGRSLEVEITRQFELTPAEGVEEVLVWQGLTWREEPRAKFEDAIVYDGFIYEPIQP